MSDARARGLIGQARQGIDRGNQRDRRSGFTSDNTVGDGLRLSDEGRYELAHDPDIFEIDADGLLTLRADIRAKLGI